MDFGRNLFIDCAVQAGSNPTVMLIKELIETEQITGEQASWAMAALGYHVKTPTQELLKELIVSFISISFHIFIPSQNTFIKISSLNLRIC